MATENLSYYDKNTIPNAKQFRFGIVVSVIDCGAEKENIISLKVPGSFELVYGSKKLIETQNLDAIIAIGNVIKGETKHFDFVCKGVTQGIVDLNIKYDIPVIFCVLTDDNKEQSIARSGGKLGNKGIECAIAGIKMASIKNTN